MNSCPFTNRTLVKHHESQLSFAQYVDNLNSQAFNITKKLDRPISRRHVKLPDLEPTPQGQRINKNFTLTHRQLVKKPKPRQYSIDMQLTLRPLKQKIIRNKSSVTLTLESEETNLYYKINGEQNLKLVIDRYYSKVQDHPAIQAVYDSKQFKQNYITFLEFALGKPVFYNLESLRLKHAFLRIKDSEFNQFKIYLIQSFLEVCKNPSILYDLNSILEQYRYIIVSKNKTFAQIYNQKLEKKNTDQNQSVFELTQSTYSKIYQDTSLSAYFQGTMLDEQAQKLGRIINKLMSWGIEQEDQLKYLRRSHQAMHLTNVHFTLFKSHLIKSMREMKIRDNQIEMLTIRMDGYRGCILDKDTFYDQLNQSKNLMPIWIKKYENLCSKDPRLKDFSQSSIEAHASYLLIHLTSQHKPTLSRRDIQQIHNNCPIKLEWYEAFRENFYSLLKNLNINSVILSDYRDVWFQLKFGLHGLNTLNKELGLDIMQNLEQKFIKQLNDIDQLAQYFKNSEYTMNQHITQMMDFIFKNRQIFKSSDLRVIHQGLKIAESTYDYLIYQMKFVMLQDPNINPGIIRIVEQILIFYKPAICNLP
ncbi:hypothetical protein pb186bvf_000169 [Paramecium bursaria]